MSDRTTVQPFFDPKTWTVSYVVADNATWAAAIIDPVLDYDFKSGHTDTTAAEAILAYLKKRGMKVEWILETHAHADHLGGPLPPGAGRRPHRDWREHPAGAGDLQEALQPGTELPA